jgi:hypothetical protein
LEKKHLKEPIDLSLKENFDEEMARLGFSRAKPHILTYVRVLAESRQSLSFDAKTLRYKNNKDSFTVQPSTLISFPLIKAGLEKMFNFVDEDVLLKNIRADGSIFAGMGGIVDYAHYAWDSSDFDDYNTKKVYEMKEFIFDHVIPYFDRMQTVDGYIQNYENSKHRNVLYLGSDIVLNICSAYCVKGRYEECFSAIERHFSGDRSQRIFKRLIEYLYTRPNFSDPS